VKRMPNRLGRSKRLELHAPQIPMLLSCCLPGRWVREGPTEFNEQLCVPQGQKPAEIC
jgi:hypothetical protein